VVIKHTVAKSSIIAELHDHLFSYETSMHAAAEKLHRAGLRHFGRQVLTGAPVRRLGSSDVNPAPFSNLTVANPFSAFELHRAKFEQIASEKFDRNIGAADLVVREEDVTL
jgi:hypothetical protein